MTYSTGKLTLELALRHRAEVNAGATFIVWESADHRWTEWTYGEADAEVDRLASGLAAAGVRPGNPVVVHSANRPELIVSLLALSRIGAVAVPTIAQYSADELAYVIGHVGAVAVICDPPRLELAEQAARLHGVGLLVAMSEETQAPWMPWSELLAEVRSGVLVAPDVEETGIVMYSSGTTARPKGIELSHRALMTSAETNAQHQRLRPEDRWLCIVPAFHVNGLLISSMSTLVTGSSIVLCEAFDFGRYMSQLRTYQPTIAFLPAMVVRRLLSEPEQPSDSVHRLRAMLYGMPLSEADVEAFERRFAVPLINLWGMTENAGLGTRTPLYLPRHGAAVGLPVLGAEVRLLDEQGQPVASGEPGRAQYGGAGLASGYLRDSEATTAVFDQGWIDTNDVMVADEFGYLTFLDREKDMIKVKAENVASGEVERVLVGHPAVSEAAVIGIPDDRLGERIIAFVVSADGTEPEPEALREHAESLLAPFKVPSEVRVVDELPKTSTEKVKKADLRQLAEAPR